MDSLEIKELAYYIVSQINSYKERLYVDNKRLYEIVTTVCLIGVPMLEKQPKVPKYDDIFNANGKESKVSKERTLLENRLKMYLEYLDETKEEVGNE